MKKMRDITVLLPKNDPESMLIGELCAAYEIPHMFSHQPHGAMLAQEYNLEERVKQANINTKTILIIEIPGPEEEKELEARGFKVDIIDHHRYPDFDRMHKKSSLEQFLEYFEITEKALKEKGFNPDLVQGVAIIDRSFVWGLEKEGYTGEKKKEIIAYYQSFLHKLFGPDRKKQEQLAEEIYKNAKKRGEFLVVHNPRPDIGVRDAVSFEIAKHHTQPVATVLWSKNRIYVQEWSGAKKLYEQFGGFMYGAEERCWGKEYEGGEIERIQKAIGIADL